MMKPQVTSTRMASCHCARVNGSRSMPAAICPSIVGLSLSAAIMAAVAVSVGHPAFHLRGRQASLYRVKAH